MLHRLDEKGKSESHSIEQLSVYRRGKIVAICEAFKVKGIVSLDRLYLSLGADAPYAWPVSLHDDASKLVRPFVD